MNRAGTIWSVSTLANGSGQATAVSVREGFHRHILPASIGRTSVSMPATAAAATIAGDIRCVRAPAPWRPLKLRLVVEAQRSPDATRSPFMPTHIEQPDAAHSRPAADEDAVEALLLGLTLDRRRARRDEARHFRLAAGEHRGRGAQVLDAAVGARADEHAIDGDAGERLARRAGPCRRWRRAMWAALAASAICAGSGTRAVIGSACSGLVPQVTVGAISAASSTTSLSKRASASLASASQASAAWSNAAPETTHGRPAQIVDRRRVGRDHAGARAGLDRHVAQRQPAFDRQRANRRARILDGVADRAVGADAGDDREDHVLGVEPRRHARHRRESRMFFGLRCQIVCVASTCATSDAPMPNA